jgi:4-hydroxy-tetrahydrodipicolinate reductase
MNKTRVIINGCKGRMGQALLACAARMEEIEVTGAIDLGDDLGAVLPAADVVIDFSHAESTAEIVRLCAEARRAIVIGTTGQGADTRSKIAEAAKSIPVVYAPNFSVGVNTLFWLTRKAAEILGPDFDLEVVEMHHRMKKDAPSGTARRLGEILAEVRGLDYEEAVRNGRSGFPGERTRREIGMHALRGGDVVGDHTVIFAAPGERLEITHKASSRDTFAFGALRAALWLREKPAGLYDMQDVLGLK